MTWWLVPSKAKRDSQELFFLVIELNLILYSPDIVVAKKGCRLYTAVYTSIGWTSKCVVYNSTIPGSIPWKILATNFVHSNSKKKC